jgi:prophage regulatory protein
MSRWKQIIPFSPFSREKFRQLVKAGKAPQPVKFSNRCTAYSNQELHRFFADPLNYTPPVKPDDEIKSGGARRANVRLQKGGGIHE